MSSTRISPELIERSFGLVAMVLAKRVVLPLKAVECEFSVAAGLVEVRMTQVFRQENPQPLDCDYLFPLPADASVYACEADINGRIIRAMVKERGEAVRLAAEKKAEGRRVTLVESERENLFTLSLKNLQPDDLVLVTLKYIQPLRHLADRLSVEIPLCPGIRYLPGNLLIRSNRGKGIADDTDQVPDASRISPVRMEAEHPDASFIEIRGRLDGRFVDAQSILSPSHNVISRPEGGSVAIRLSDKGEVPDRDFVLRWTETKAEEVAARAWIQEAGEETYALMEIRAPKASGPPAPMDIYFLVDRSGSMKGLKWQKAALAVQTCAAKLAENDRVMLTLFNSGIRDFAEQPLPPAPLLADANFQRLEQLSAEGGTELFGAVRHVLELAAAHSTQRKKTLILITDAQVGNESSILKIMGSAPDFPVHCFGIDMALNDGLLMALSRQQQGTFHSLNPSDDVVKVVSDLAATFRHPVLDELRLSDGWEPSVKFLPPLYSGQVFCVSARSSRRQPIALAAKNGGPRLVELPVLSQPATGNAPHLHWCKNRIQSLIAADDVQAAITLSIQSNLICPLTAFIAWDEYEKVAVASHELMQPNVMPVNDEMFLSKCMPRPHLDNLFIRRPLHRQSNAAVEWAMPHAMEAEACLSDVPRPEPREVVKSIVEHAGRSGFSQTEPPFLNPIDRRLALRSLFCQIWDRCLLGGFASRWHQIERWVFDDNRLMLERSALVAKLLWELNAKADRFWAAYNQIFNQLMELDQKAGSAKGNLTRVMQIMSDRTRTEAELIQLIEAEFHHHSDPKLIADYLRIPVEINEAVETFAKQHLKT